MRMEEPIVVEPIGIIRSPLHTLEEAPPLGSEAGVEGELVVDPKYLDAMLGLEVGRKVLILYWLHLGDRKRLQVHPRGDLSRPLRGVFATRSPHRPNPIGADLVEILEIRENVIRVKGLDALDGTRLLDIKKDV